MRPHANTQKIRSQLWQHETACAVQIGFREKEPATHWSCHRTWICEFLLRSEWQYKNRASFVTASKAEPASKSVLAALICLFSVATGGV